MAASPDAAGYFDLQIDFHDHILTPFGELDATTAPILLDAVDAFTTTRPIDVLTIDLACVSFADSALLDALVQIRGTLGERRTTLRLVNQSPSVQRLFRAAAFTGSDVQGLEVQGHEVQGPQTDIAALPQ